MHQDLLEFKEGNEFADTLAGLSAVIEVLVLKGLDDVLERDGEKGVALQTDFEKRLLGEFLDVEMFSDFLQQGDFAHNALVFLPYFFKGQLEGVVVGLAELFLNYHYI